MVDMFSFYMISQYVSEVSFCRTSRSVGDSSSDPRGSVPLFPGGCHHLRHLETRKEQNREGGFNCPLDVYSSNCGSSI